MDRHLLDSAAGDASWRAYGQNLLLSSLIRGLRLLPYRRRVPLCGWAFSQAVARLAGYDQRVRDNLALIMPDLPKPEVDRLCRAVPFNIGCTLMELYSGAEFRDHVKDTPILGEGLESLLRARKTGQGVILVSGHLGNYDVVRAVLAQRGYPVGGLYKPLSNPYFHRHYLETISQIPGPLFERGRRGLGEMVKFLREGGMLGMLIDQHMNHGAKLTFMGHPAKTALSAAQLALRYDLLLVPSYGVRRPDGLTFDLVIEPPIARSTSQKMTQALNDSLERQVRKNPAQWLWSHRRWRC